MEEKKTPLTETVDDIKEYQNKVKENAENSQDVKDGKCTKEEELKEPAYLLYNQIAEANIQILQMPPVVKAFEKLNESLGEDAAKTLVELLAILMTQSSHQAVLFYDDLLKQELKKQFDLYGDFLNNTIADVSGIKSAIEVIKTRLGNFERDKKVEQFSKENNITPDPNA